MRLLRGCSASLKTPRLTAALLFAAACLASALISRGVADQIIYDDARRKGWQDYGWATLNYTNTSPVHSGSNSISVTAGPYEAVYVHHSVFNNAAYTNLTFWIHGGANGGQSLKVQAVTNGGVMAQQFNLPVLTTNWQQIAVPLSSLGAANRTDVDGFWIENRNGTNIPTFCVDDWSLVAVPPPDVVSISVNAGQVVSTVDPRFFGLNAVIWDDNFDSANTVSLLNELDNRLLRFPGGSLSDEYHWTTGKSGTNTFTWATSFSNFLHVATNTRAHVFITVNCGSGTPAEAAAWVRHANVTNNLGFKYWEVGNENYGTWETHTNARPNDAWTYANRFTNYYAQMKAADPTIKVGAVIINGEDSYANFTDHPATNSRTLAVHNGWTPVLLSRLKTLGVTPDFAIYHRYEQGPGAENDAALLQSAGDWTNDAAGLRLQLSDYLGAAATNVELVVTENNSVYTTPGKQTTSLVNGLYLADSVGQVLQTEFNALVWWDLRNSQDLGNNNSAALYGWRNYGDYGILDGSGQIAPTNRYPTSYVAKLLKYFARGGDRVVRATTDSVYLSAYAVRRTNGFLTLLVINKTPTNALNANISLAGFGSVSNALVYSYGIPQDEAVRTNNPAAADLARTNVVVSGTNVNYTFAPYSVTVLALTGGPVVNVLPVQLQSNGQFRLQVQSLPDVRYSLQRTSNFTAWPALTTNTLTNETFDWSDAPSAGRSNLFYRAQWVP